VCRSTSRIRSARPSVDLKFVNEGNGMAEGTFIFRCPQGAAGRSVDHDHRRPNHRRQDPAGRPGAPRSINDIVRQYRDPALLEYVGSQARAGQHFPDPARRLAPPSSFVIAGTRSRQRLLHYVYPLDVDPPDVQPHGRQRPASAQGQRQQPRSATSTRPPRHRRQPRRRRPQLSAPAGKRVTTGRPGL